jgi:hypothetical protein
MTMIRLITWTFIALLPLLAAGCVTVEGGIAENLHAIPPDRGLVLFSTSADETNLSLNTSLRLVQGSTLRKYDKVVINLNYPFSGSQFHVRSLLLPEGYYYLQPLSLNPQFVVTNAPIYRFTVRAGRATHIGNFHLSLPHVSRVRESRKTQGRLSWSGETYARDVEYFKARNPEFRNRGFDRQAVSIGPPYSSFKTQGAIEEIPE